MTPLDQLESDLATRPDHTLVVAGIGVSLQTCANHPNATWKGLLRHGLQWLSERGIAEARVRRKLDDLDAHDSKATELIGVASFITAELHQIRDGEFNAWLADVAAGIVAADPRLVRALASLGGELATTNYDHMLEMGTTGSAITWRQNERCAQFFRDQSRDVLHLHGSFSDPQSVVLGADSYARVCGEGYFQGALRAWMLLNTFVFVGCGEGLGDPNFATLLEWSKSILAQSPYNSFMLVRNCELDSWRTRLMRVPIQPIGYGDNHDHLTPFIEGLARRVQERR